MKRSTVRKLTRCAAAATLALVFVAPAARAGDFAFPSIDGGTIEVGAATAGRPVLVVNTASLCAFTPQYEGLQDLHEAYGARGLLVLAVPSDDFRQELGSEADVAEFCELTFGLDLPMTEISHVRGPDALPFYDWVRQETGFEPRWNFDKVLLGTDGAVVGTWRSTTRPEALRDEIEALLPG